jgi:DNA-binding NarL/FixJ family response regulator
MLAWVLGPIVSDEPCQLPKEFSTMQTKLHRRPRVVVAEQNEQILRNGIVQQHCEVVKEVGDREGAIAAVHASAGFDRPRYSAANPWMASKLFDALVRALKNTCPVPMLTGFEDHDYIDAAIVAGANGFVYQRIMGRDLLSAIAEVLAGRTFVSTHPRT